MSLENKKKLFPRYTALINKSEQQAKIKDLAWKIFTIVCQLVGIIYIVFIGYLFLTSFFNYEPSDPVDRVQESDYSPYSGWTYE